MSLCDKRNRYNASVHFDGHTVTVSFSVSRTFHHLIGIRQFGAISVEIKECDNRHYAIITFRRNLSRSDSQLLNELLGRHNVQLILKETDKLGARDEGWVSTNPPMRRLRATLDTQPPIRVAV